MATARETALQTALMSLMIASKKQGYDLRNLVDCALPMTDSYPRDLSGKALSRATIELQHAYNSVLMGERLGSKEA
ncbi:hypothetical protein ACIOV9_03220 [Pseudomonas iridis]|uniref:hypothetical protein n=1 Tax=Pseudomonas TaxID=286 RepID=UPI001B33D17B|nr:hypothetical protein [Pseudomonas sp. P42]MBP5953968.1 hypothetical protein [Pseudomonas sp. P42]